MKTATRANVDAFLRDASRLTLEQWQTVYARYFGDPKFRRAGRVISGMALQAHLAQQNALAPGQQLPADPFRDGCAARIKAIGRAFPGELLDPEQGADRSQAVNMVLGITLSALLHREALLAEPSKARALTRFLSLFDGVIDVHANFSAGTGGAV